MPMDTTYDKADVEHRAMADAGSHIDSDHSEQVLTGTSVREQLNTWHAHRGNRSFVSCIPPVPHRDPTATANPFKFLRGISWTSWGLFFSGWFCWTCDGYDYFAVSLTMDHLAEQFDKSTSDITTAITLTLLFRSVGALLFGALADRYGRKWTLVINTLLIAVFELGSGFVNTYAQFLAVRSCFGIVMGGIWGQAAATSLENIPAEARGFASGVVQQGYAVGYLLAAVINLGVVEKHGWRSLYFIGAGFSCAAAIVRACLPESQQYIEARKHAAESGLTAKEATRSFLREFKNMLKTNWIRCIWGILFMTGMNFFSHGSQDMFPKYLTTTKFISSQNASKITIISNCGAVAGGMIGGYMSQYLGRRLSVIILACWTACWIPLWILPNNFGGLAAGGFFIQSGVQGAWGVVPIYLTEISPPAFRALFSGLAYQLGNMASAGSAQIVATAGKTLRIHKGGKYIADYATIEGIFIGAIIAWLLVVTLLGPDADGSHFENAKVAYEDGSGRAAGVAFVEDGRRESHVVDPEHRRQKEVL